MTTTRSQFARKALGRGLTAPCVCSIRIPSAIPMLPPTPCGGRHFKAGRCAEHYREWRAAREARGIEAREFRAKQIAGGHVTKRGRVVMRTERVTQTATVYTPPEVRWEARDFTKHDEARLARAAEKRARKCERRLVA